MLPITSALTRPQSTSLGAVMLGSVTGDGLGLAVLDDSGVWPQPQNVASRLSSFGAA